MVGLQYNSCCYAALLAELDDLFKPERIQGDRYAVASQREVDTEKYAFEAV
jgi:hypothetical protein